MKRNTPRRNRRLDEERKPPRRVRVYKTPRISSYVAEKALSRDEFMDPERAPCLGRRLAS